MITSNLYSYNDLMIVPAVVSEIESRKECDVHYYRWPEKREDDVIKFRLPIFTAPMDSVADDENYQVFESVGVTPIIHRNVKLEKRLSLTVHGKWCAYSLSEFENIFCSEENFPEWSESNQGIICALMDCANGHMKKIFDLADKAHQTVDKINETAEKKLRLVLMAGNIANSETYIEYCKHGIDYVRCSIGTGSMCLTTANTAVGYPNASLINQIRYIRSTSGSYKTPHFTWTKIIADGGIKNYSDAVIALACGADYVMIGGIFAACVDSCADFKTTDLCCEWIYTAGDTVKISTLKTTPDIPFVNSDIKITERENSAYIDIEMPKYCVYISNVADWILNNIPNIHKTSHGMSSKEAQIGNLQSRGETVERSKLKTSEGKTIVQKSTHTVAKWTENFISYLQSCMSYCNITNVLDMSNCQLVIKSPGTMMSVNK